MQVGPRAYLAASSYADDCGGIALAALARSRYRDNTVVVIFGDHGWHLGEKLRFRKATLWQEATRLPLMIRVPGVTTAKENPPRVVNLMDLYATLTELCGLPPKAGIDGRSIVPLLKQPDLAWPHPTVVINGRGNACVRDERWYHIRYRDGTEEFYDMRNDPMQWKNLARSTDPRIVAEKRRLMTCYPKTFARDVFRDPIKQRIDPRAPAMPNPNLKRDLSALQ